MLLLVVVVFTPEVFDTGFLINDVVSSGICDAGFLINDVVSPEICDIGFLINDSGLSGIVNSASVSVS